MSAISGCVSTSALASLVPVGITSSVAGLKTSAINAGIKKYNSIIKKRKRHNNIVLRAKTKLNTLEALISKALTNSYINYEELVLVNNVLREHDSTKDEIKNSKTSVK